MRRVLIAFDGSEGAGAALHDLTRGGLRVGTIEARVLTIADVWVPPAADEEPGDIFKGTDRSRNAAREQALLALKNARDTAQKGARALHALFPDWTITSAAHADSPAWGIVAEARRWRADLIVIGSHGRTPLERFFLGSVSAKVAAEAGCSVRIVRSHVRPRHRRTTIVIALDGSPSAEAAAREAEARQWRTGTRFELVTIVDLKLQSAGAWIDGLISPPRADDRARDWIQPMQLKHAEKLRERGYDVKTHILEGEPKSLLLRHAEASGADCIFMGAQGVQHSNRLYLGTLASAIATRAHCTVEIVRPGVPHLQPPSRETHEAAPQAPAC